MNFFFSQVAVFVFMVLKNECEIFKFFLKCLYCSDSLYKTNKGMYNCSLHQLLTVVCARVMRW
jgi:hypothetical protein